jgi:hypothetical protein
MNMPVFRRLGFATPRYITNYDSATAMLLAQSDFLKGMDFPGLGVTPPVAKPVATVINKLPRKVREQLYTWTGWKEAIPPNRLSDVRAEEISQWVTNLYPERSYPAVMIGSSNGAGVHLGAALGIPWLPQTYLISVRRSGIHPDDLAADMEWARKPGRTLLEANPELQLHQLHDPSQDRLMIQRMTYFRTKRLWLGETYEQFLTQNLEPGGTILVMECTRRWPTTEVGERHFFQPGGMGGTREEEYIEGSDRVVNYLERYDSHRRRFDTPMPDGLRPEAEWGFEPSLRDDIERFAARHGYRVRRILFEEPEHFSPLVAELYRWWYRERRIHANRLQIECFHLLEPYWALRTGSVPFWMTFNMRPSLEFALEYLDSTGQYDYINMMLINHGVEAIDLPSIQEWRTVLDRARLKGSFVGLDEARFPRDFASFVNYYNDIKKVPARYPMPGSLPISQLDRFLSEHGHRFPVEWLDGSGGHAQAAD